MNTLVQNRPGHDYNPEIGKPFFLSVVLHVLVFTMVTLGFPYFVKKPELLLTPISVEMITVSEMQQSRNLAASEADPEKSPEPVKRDPVPPREKPNPPPKQDLVEPVPPKVEDVPEPPQDDLQAVKDEPVKKEVPEEKPPKPLAKPKPPEKIEEKPKQEEKIIEEEKKPERTLDSILKDITPHKDEPAPRVDALNENKDLAGQGPVSDFVSQVTRGEQDALDQAIGLCWNVQAGGKNAQDQIVPLRAYLNPDMTVRDVQILDESRYNADPHYRAAAEAARRALINPRCRDLSRPLESRRGIRVIDFTFDPSHML